MNKIWLGILLISFLYGIITKRFDTMATIILSLPQKGLELVCTLVFSAVFWNGIMYILADCGAIQFISKLLTPLLDLIMPQMKDKEARELISTNIAANMLGLGFAATPSGLKAMKRLKLLSDEEKGVASDAMVTFLVLNTAGVTIIPTSVIAIRQQYGAINPADFVICGIISTLFACVVGLLFDVYYRNKRLRKNKK